MEEQEKGQGGEERQGGDNIFDGLDIDTMLKIMEIMEKMNEKNDTASLIAALRPMLSPENQKKADTAAKIAKLMSLLPLLRESGISLF
ncbi:hypothetical protein FACS1894120_1340 [Clostridia bacterium]|nr:hypothetical protein FACS1894120_1340 [Clostridia bacterium]